MSLTSKAVRREDLTKGDPIYVLTRISPTILKRRKGRVVDVLRAAAVVDHIEGESGAKTIRFNDLELVVPGAPPLPAVERLGDSPAVSPVKPLRAVPPAFSDLENREPERRRQEPTRRRVVAPAEAPIAAAEPEPVRQESAVDFTSWIAQGTAMRERVNEQVMQLKIDLDTLTTQQLELEEKIAGKRKELVKAEAVLGALDQLGGAVKP